MKDHEWPLDGSPSSGGEIYLPGLAVGCVGSVRTAVAAWRHSACSHEDSNLGRFGRCDRRFQHHCPGNNGDSNQDLTGGLTEKLTVR